MQKKMLLWQRTDKLFVCTPAHSNKFGYVCALYVRHSNKFRYMYAYMYATATNFGICMHICTPQQQIWVYVCIYVRHSNKLNNYSQVKKEI